MSEKEQAPLEYRKEWARLRALLFDASSVHLATDPRDRHVWLTDMVVLLRVSGSIAVAELPDGEYKVSASAGLVASGRPNGLDPMAYFDLVESGAPSWAPVRTTEWSLAESQIKAMLVYGQHDSGRRVPMLIAEGLWTAYRKHYEGCEFEAARANDRNLFRVVHEGDAVAYIAGGICRGRVRYTAKGIIGRCELTPPVFSG